MTDEQTKPERGVDICMRCEGPISDNKFGYCDDCLKAQEEESDELLEIQSVDYEWARKYSERRKKELQRFVKQENVELITLAQAIEIDDKTNIRGILSPELAASLTYPLVLPVSYIFDVNEEKKDWFRKYWLQKYEIELEPFDHQVGLIFESEGYHGYYTKVYDFPSSIFSSFAIVNSSQGIQLKGDYFTDDDNYIYLVKSKRSDKWHVVKNPGTDPIETICGKGFIKKFSKMHNFKLLSYTVAEDCCLDLLEVIS